MIVYGKQVAREASRVGLNPKRVWCKKNLFEFAKSLFPKSDIRVVHPKVISSLCNSDDHQGIAFEVYLREKKISEISFRHDAVFVFLDGVQDVGNIGNIIRTSEFFGCSAVILEDTKSPDITPAMVKSSAGAIFHIPVVKAGAKEFLERAKNKGFYIYSFDVRGKTTIFDVNFELPAVLCFGSEDKGISPYIISFSDFVIRIPQKGKVESLNVSSSVAVALGILHQSMYSKI